MLGKYLPFKNPHKDKHIDKAEKVIMKRCHTFKSPQKDKQAYKIEVVLPTVD